MFRSELRVCAAAGYRPTPTCPVLSLNSTLRSWGIEVTVNMGATGTSVVAATAAYLIPQGQHAPKLERAAAASGTL